MEFFDSTKSIVENLYLLSGPLIFLIGIIGLVQLKLTKKAIIISSQRSSAQLAAEQVEMYNNNIIPMQDNLFIERSKEKVSKISYKQGEFNRKSIYALLGEDTAKKYSFESGRLKTAIPFLRVINAMEAFSIYFIKGVADEEIAFSSVGQTFCDTIKSLHFDIAIVKTDEDAAFQNTIELYKLWSSRIEKNNLFNKKEQLTNELNKIFDKKIPPIGTK